MQWKHIQIYSIRYWCRKCCSSKWTSCLLLCTFGASAGAVNVVTSDLSDSNEVGAGVLQSAPTDGQYAWIQIGGTATLSIALTAGADGDPLTPTGATDGTLDVTAAATSPVCAFAIDASAKIIACQFAG